MAQTLSFAERRAAAAWTLLLAGREPIDSLHRRVRLVGDDLDGFVHAGQERVALTVSLAGEALRRVARIEAFDPDELRLDVALPVACDPEAHGWTEAARIGDPVRVELLDL
ncbi:MAG TPA: hypothetical protein VKT30_00075 [Caulobacteraceae bacterium]|nr:hypothetical protein [Caulobacteraceae bacterium]